MKIGNRTLKTFIGELILTVGLVGLLIKVPWLVNFLLVIVGLLILL